MTVILNALALFLATNTQAQETPPAAAMNLEHCKPRMSPHGSNPLQSPALAFELSQAGGLSVDTKHPEVVSYDRKPDGTESVVMRASNPMVPGSSVRQTVILRKADGRPDTIEQTIDQIKERKLWFNSTKQAMPTMGQRFTYDKDGACHVKQIYFKDKKGKEHVAYDREMCAELLQASKKLTKEKTKECQDAFGAMWRAIQKAANRLKAEGKELQSELGFFYPHASAGSADQSFTHMLVAGRCQGTLAMFGETDDTKATLAQDLMPPSDAGTTETKVETEVETAQ